VGLGSRFAMWGPGDTPATTPDRLDGGLREVAASNDSWSQPPWG
jgi:hypothetical protein